MARGRGRRRRTLGYRGLWRGIWNDWEDVGWSLPPWDSRGFKPAQTRPCLQLPSRLNVTHSSPETVSKNLGSESALVLAQSGTFTVASQLFTSVWTFPAIGPLKEWPPYTFPHFLLSKQPTSSSLETALKVRWGGG